MNELKAEICKQICKRSECNNIELCDGIIKEKCIKKGVSCIENLNKEQDDYILSDMNKNIYLKACPGSGKTEVLGIKSAYEINKWSKKNSGIAILTFTNSAEDEIRKRVEGYLNRKIEYPHFLGTFTSWIHGYIAHPFIAKAIKYEGNDNGDKSIKIIDCDSNTEFLKIFSTKYSYEILGHIRANQYYFDIKSKKYIYNGNIFRDGNNILQNITEGVEWRVEDLKKTKFKLWKSGYANYEDIEYIVFCFLSKNLDKAKVISKRFPNIFIDECQDLSYIQLRILNILKESGSSLHFIGDIDQSIYKFRNIELNDIIQYIKKGDFKEQELNINYRSCQKVVDLCDNVIKRKSNIKGEQEEKCSEPLIALLYKQNKEQAIINKFEKLIDNYELNHNESRIIVRNRGLKNKLLGIKTNDKPNKLEILVQGIYIENKNSSVDEYKKGFINICDSLRSIYFNESKHKNINEFYSPEDMDTLSWKLLVSKIIKYLIEDKRLLNYDLTWTEWKKVLKELLNLMIENIEELKDCNIKLPNVRSGNSKKSINQTLFNSNSNRIRYDISTIHACKGLSLDAVLFISSYKDSKNGESGSYWKQWFDTKIIDEKNRIAYVGFSRAKYLLVLGIPKTNSFSNEDYNFLKLKGFKVIDIDENV
ncbi:UvrD-helicase domain-containing protein [Eubacterium multiforme]|uniref:DNA 3'-5' helicase n=1 Tax=Eubacterium multiforme TaxID=83339 RepID=A0ABT9UXG7_9FIRM|nr:ATP-dependent helicase [Eubacterium multiforme]MDQ0151020.1 DNA helicase-2/ATP-dependent DNA helicase PcrA [Eubacterium multiforme]